MQISRLELENIKSHTSSSFDFGHGTTAITGQNGAGKTTILEAIAWVLFDLLEYKKEDFLRRGAKKGSATVTFESSLDGREYIVKRDTGTAYFVTDGRLGAKLAEKKEEVQRFLWQHLGLEPGTDLRTLFRQAIGVPQGTFTAIFLESATDRKIAFDRLLKVEEYRQAAEKLRETSRYLDNSIADAREQIARSEGEIARAEAVESQYQDLSSQIRQLATEKETLENVLAEKKVLVDRLDARASEVATLQTTFDKISADLEKNELVTAQLSREVDTSRTAAAIVGRIRPDAERHTAALQALSGLESARAKRDAIQAELTKADNAAVAARGSLESARKELANAKAAAAEIETLAPQATQQERLERDAANTRDRILVARAAASQIKSIDARLDELRELYKTNHSDLKKAEERAGLAAELVDLETRSGELTRALASLQANLARDEQFQKEITNGLCPILSKKCLNLKAGESLESFVTSQFVGLKAEIARFEKEHAENQTRIALAREAQKAAASVESLRRREKELGAEGQRLRAERDAHEKTAAILAELERELRTAENGLKKLNDPRPRLKLLTETAGRKKEFEAAVDRTEKELQRLDGERTRIAASLNEFADLDNKWNASVIERDGTAEAYRTLLANEKEASLLDQRIDQLKAAEAERDTLASKKRTAEQQLRSAETSYDRAAHDTARKDLSEAQQSHASVAAKLQTLSSNLDQLSKELEKIAEIRHAMAADFKKKEDLERTAETTAFIRDTLKEAAPRVARNYVYHVSVEANQMFREISGDAERSLKWAEDYSIVLEDGGYERPFQSLSGGEQMAAALSVRLAILKQLTDIRIAFFDEPTANMDIERRENFAEEISRIKHFDQLFVISHDETFDNYVDNVIALN
ncbi:MAG: SMC family ATPase [Acidobacteria bacterium]|nr:SMC family ATPase [Acidobacteriota bacterium]